MIHPVLTYQFMKNDPIGFPHRLFGALPEDLVIYEAFNDQFPSTLDGYGIRGKDYVTGYGSKVFNIYFKDKVNAMRFKLAWA